MTILDIGKNILNSFKTSIAQNQEKNRNKPVGRGTQKVRNYFNPEVDNDLNQYGVQNFWTNNPIKIASGLGNAQKFVEKPPKFNFSDTLSQRLETPGERAVSKFVLSIPESVLNIPSNSLEAGAQLGKDVRTGAIKRPSVLIGSTAKAAMPIIDAYTLGGGTILKNIGKEAVKGAAKQTFKQAVARSAVVGGKYGGIYGALQGLAEGRDKKTLDQFTQAIKSGAVGALIGGSVGGATGGVGNAIGTVWNAYKGIHPDLSDAEITKKTAKFILSGGQPRDTKGRFTTNTTPVKPTRAQRIAWEETNKILGRPLDTPVYPTDADKAVRIKLGYPEDGNSQSGFIDFGIFGKKNGGSQSPAIKGKSGSKIDILQPEGTQAQRSVLSSSQNINGQLSGQSTFPLQNSSQIIKSPQQGIEVLAEERLPSGLPKADVSNVNTMVQKEQLLPQTNLTQPTKQQQGNQNQVLKFGKSSPSEKIIAEAKGEIGRIKDDEKKSVKELADELYTQWVDRYHPVNQLAGKAEKIGQEKGFVIRPENNPKFAIRRFLGMGGIAEQRYESQLKPILNQLDELGIDKGDMDVYLKARRDINLSQRGVIGSNAEVARQRIAAIEQKYGTKPNEIAEQLYRYQQEGFQELGKDFLGQDATKAIEKANVDYVPFVRKMDDVLDEYLGIPTKKAMQGTNPVKSIKGSEKQIYSPIESIIANTFKQRAAIEKNRVAKSIVGLQNIIPDLQLNKVAKSGADTITVWEDGIKSYYQVGQDIADAVKGMNEEQMNSVLKILSAPSSLLRQAATGRNPEFMIPNMVRDQLDAGINSKYGYIPFIDYARGFAHVLRKDDVYQKWINSGASMNFSELSGRKSIQQMYDSKATRKKLTGWLSEGLDRFGMYSEQPTRLGLFSKALKKTGNETLAMMESRDSTLDFSRMGSKMKVANSIVPFLNVGIQGFDKMIRQARSNPGMFALKMGIYGATPATMFSLYNNAFHPQEYEEIPSYVKNANFVIVTGRGDQGKVQYIAIPKGNVIQYIANPIDNFISYLANTNSESFGEMATQFLSSGLPVLGDGSTPKEVAIKTIGSNLPQAIKPAAENLLNKSFYKYNTKTEESKEIVPYYLKDKPPGEQDYEFTPSMYKAIGRTLNVSPLLVQNAMEGYLAGYSKIPANIIDGLVNMGEGGEVEKNKIPILRRFIQETYPSSSSGKNVLDTTKDNSKRTGLFGKAEASDGKPYDEVSYVDDSGKKKTISLAPPTKGQGIGAFANRDWNITKAREVWNAGLPEQQRSAVLKQLGVKPEDARYDALANYSVDIKTQYIVSKNLEHDELIERLITGRVESVSGELFASNGVIDNLYEQGLITSEERTALKKMKFDKDGKDLSKSTGKKKKGKKVSISSTTIKSEKLPESVFKLTQPTKLNLKSSPKLNLKTSAAKAGDIPKFKASGFRNDLA